MMTLPVVLSASSASRWRDSRCLFRLLTTSSHFRTTTPRSFSSSRGTATLVSRPAASPAPPLPPAARANAPGAGLASHRPGALLPLDRGGSVNGRNPSAEQPVSANDQINAHYALTPHSPTHITTVGHIIVSPEDSDFSAQRKLFPHRRNLLNTEKPSIRQELLEDPDRLGMQDPLSKQDKRLASELLKLNTMRRDLVSRWKQENPWLYSVLSGSAMGVLLIALILKYMLRDAESFTQQLLFDVLKWWYTSSSHTSAPTSTSTSTSSTYPNTYFRIGDFYERLIKWARSGYFPLLGTGTSSGDLRQVLFEWDNDWNWYGCEEELLKLLGKSFLQLKEDDDDLSVTSRPHLSVKELKDREYGAPLRAKFAARAGAAAGVGAKEEQENTTRSDLHGQETENGPGGGGPSDARTGSAPGLLVHAPIQLGGGLDYTGELTYAIGGCGVGMVTVGPFQVVADANAGDPPSALLSMGSSSSSSSSTSFSFADHLRLVQDARSLPSLEHFDRKGEPTFVRKVSVSEFAQLPLFSPFRSQIDKWTFQSVRSSVQIGVHFLVGGAGAPATTSTSTSAFEKQKINSQGEQVLNSVEADAETRLEDPLLRALQLAASETRVQYFVVELGGNNSGKTDFDGQEADAGAKRSLVNQLASTAAAERVNDKPIFFQIADRREFEDLWLPWVMSTPSSRNRKLGFIVPGGDLKMLEQLFCAIHRDDPRFVEMNTSQEQQVIENGTSATTFRDRRKPRHDWPIILQLQQQSNNRRSCYTQEHAAELEEVPRPGGRSTRDTTTTTSVDILDAFRAYELGANVVQIGGNFLAEKGVPGLIDFRLELGHQLGRRGGVNCVHQLVGKKLRNRLAEVDDQSTKNSKTTKKKKRVYRPGSPQLGNSVLIGLA
eukprot:g3723.t1